MSREEQQFLGKFETAWQDSYAGRHARQVGPREVQALMTDLDSSYGPDDEPDFNYDWLLEYLEEYSGLPEAHVQGVEELGWHAASLCEYGETTEDMFGWGYSLYASLAHYYGGQDMPHYSFEWIVQTAFTTPDIRQWAYDLADDAKDHAGLLHGLADALLDGLVRAYDLEGNLDEDYGPGQDFENQQIRQNRLLVVRAGIGQAFRHVVALESGAPADWLRYTVAESDDRA